MSLITIILFFVYTWGLGFTATSFLKHSNNSLERNIMRMGIGLGVFVVLGAILNLLHIPLDWKVFLLFSIVYPLFVLDRKSKSEDSKLSLPELNRSNIHILIVLLIFAACLWMYAGGSFNYPYLEDDDPWLHAVGSKYISVEQTAYNPSDYFLKYVDPHPPGYDLLMGVLHQTNDSLYWTLKFFNGLILSLGIVFFYFFSKEFMRDKNRALFSTFVLAAIPSFFTHFIWEHSLVIILFFPLMYALEMIKKDENWKYIAAILLSSLFLIQPSQPIKLCVMLVLYWLIKSISQKRFQKEIAISLIYGLILSLTWWFNKGKGIINL